MSEESRDEKPVLAEIEERGFFDKSLGVKFLIGILLTLALLLFLHFRSVPIESLDLHSIADEEIIAPVDFEVPDEEATLLARQAARQQIGVIYRLSGQQVEQVREATLKQFEEDQTWRAQLPDLRLEELDDAVDGFVEAIVASRFTDAKTLEEILDLDLSDENYFLFTPPSVDQSVQLPSEVWEHLAEASLGEKGVSEEIISLVTAPFAAQSWRMLEDHNAQRTLQRAIQQKVPQQMRTVPAGTRIVDRGDEITARHVVALSAMQQTVEAQRNVWRPAAFSGSLLLTLLLVGVGAAFLRSYQTNIYQSNKKLFLVVSIIILTLAIAKLAEFILLRTSSNLTDSLRYPLFLPFIAILLCSLTNPRLATFCIGFVALILVITLPVPPVEFLILNFVAGMVAILNTRSLRKRKEVFTICAKTWAACVVIVIAFHLYDNTLTQWSSLISDLLTTLLSMALTSVLVIGLLPLLESFFCIVTDITLMEFMDPAHPLLRRLALEAPGTYHHSIVLGNITEAAATAIGANGLFCRAATLYHDVGKLANPQFFTENQSGGMNIHQLLTPLESAQVILNHVPEGVALARKHNLPEPFIDIIKEHHGTTLVYYFYRKQIELMGGDAERVDEADFRYAGPPPRSKESAIIMMADSVEAASRSLDSLTEESVRKLINSIVKQRAEAGQFNQSPLTFQELQVVKESIAKTLLIASHTRIKYPAAPQPSEELPREPEEKPS